MEDNIGTIDLNKIMESANEFLENDQKTVNISQDFKYVAVMENRGGYHESVTISKSDHAQFDDKTKYNNVFYGNSINEIENLIKESKGYHKDIRIFGYAVSEDRMIEQNRSCYEYINPSLMVTEGNKNDILEIIETVTDRTINVSGLSLYKDIAETLKPLMVNPREGIMSDCIQYESFQHKDKMQKQRDKDKERYDKRIKATFNHSEFGKLANKCIKKYLNIKIQNIIPGYRKEIYICFDLIINTKLPAKIRKSSAYKARDIKIVNALNAIPESFFKKNKDYKELMSFVSSFIKNNKDSESNDAVFAKAIYKAISERKTMKMPPQKVKDKKSLK